MEFSYKKCSCKIGYMAPDYGRKRDIVRLAYASRNKESFTGLGGKMRVFLTLTSLIVFLYGTGSGAAIHTYIESQIQKTQLHEAQFIISLSPRSLSEIKI